MKGARQALVAHFNDRYIKGIGTVDIKAKLSRGDYMVEPALIAEALIARLFALEEARNARLEAGRTQQAREPDRRAT